MDILEKICNLFILIWQWLMDNIFYINIVLSLVIVFFQRREPKAVWAWLLLLYFIPIVGFLFYLILVQDYHKKKMFRTKEIEDELNSAIRKQEDLIHRKEFEFDEPNLEEFEDLVLYNLETSSAVYEEGNTLDIFTDGNDKFASLIKDLKKAKTFICMQYYIIRDDELLARIEEVLIERAKAGVEIRILYDGMGGNGLKKKKLNFWHNVGIKTGVFFPAFLGRFQMRMNYRNHRKLVIIDGEVGYIGGFNIGREYLGLNKKFGFWRDTHLRITGPSVPSLLLRFTLDWNYATKENLFSNFKISSFPIVETGDVSMQIVASGPDSKRAGIRDNYLQLINKAKHTIYIQTPYFIPDDTILQALSIKALSGVEVKVMIPCKPDHPFVYWATYSYVGELIDSGAKCYTYNNGFLHSKGIMVDSKVCSYGTANMDMRSFILNFEVNAIIYDKKTTEKLESIFLDDLSHCTELTKYNYARRSIIIRFKEQLSRLLAPLM